MDQSRKWIEISFIKKKETSILICCGNKNNDLQSSYDEPVIGMELNLKQPSEVYF